MSPTLDPRIKSGVTKNKLDPLAFSSEYLTRTMPDFGYRVLPDSRCCGPLFGSLITVGSNDQVSDRSASENRKSNNEGCKKKWGAFIIRRLAALVGSGER